MSDGDPLAFAQKIFEESYNNATLNKQGIHRDVIRRRTLAFSLKAIAVFGGIAVTAGLPEKAAQVVGIAIAVAVAIDSLLMNQIRLVTLSKADNAYKHLLRDTANTHSVELGPIIQLKATQPEKALKKLIELNTSLKQRLDRESKVIDQAVEESDVKALNALSLESERQAARQ